MLDREVFLIDADQDLLLK